MEYSKAYQERVVLEDGTPITLRAILPTDKAALADGFARLSERTRRRRFFSPKRELGDEELRFYTEFDGADHYAIGAAVKDESAGVGVARFVRVPENPTMAELAIVVADAWQGRGIGKRLLKGIVAAAAERGITRIRGETLADNEQIRRLLDHHSAHLETHSDHGVLHFSFPILNTARREPVADDGRSGGVNSRQTRSSGIRSAAHGSWEALLHSTDSGSRQ